jgi:peptidoglycan hydrolase-like protein with peptidoglycan-binding domain
MLDALTTKLQSLEAQARSTPTQSSSSYVFSRNLTLFDTGTDVQMLQKYLNHHGFLVAPSGPGSSGNETTKFGAKTWAALVKFQKSVGIPGTGYFGPVTRAYVNAHQ